MLSKLNFSVTSRGQIGFNYTFSFIKSTWSVPAFKHVVLTGGFILRGRRTDGKLNGEIAELLKIHRPADVVAVMAGLPRRTLYRIIAKLKAEDEKRKIEKREQFRESMYQQTTSRLKNYQSRKRFKKVGDLPPNLWRVRSF
jgi:hypothetical protein